jgi:hypothetical protein
MEAPENQQGLDMEGGFLSGFVRTVPTNENVMSMSADHIPRTGTNAISKSDAGVAVSRANFFTASRCNLVQVGATASACDFGGASREHRPTTWMSQVIGKHTGFYVGVKRWLRVC